MLKLSKLNDFYGLLAETLETLMAKGSAVRQRDKKRKPSSLHDNKEVAHSSSDTEQIKENSLGQNFWKYCTFALLLLLSGISLFYCKENVLFSRNLSLQNSFQDSPENVEIPCYFGDEFSIDRRSNLSLREFIHCYDAKRYYKNAKYPATSDHRACASTCQNSVN